MKRRIAVLDDDDELRKFLAMVLERDGHRVDGFGTPGRFFDGVLKSKPDLCLIDVQLPGMDGRDVVRVLRSDAATRATPLILMTAVAISPVDAVRGLDGGADEYLSKPFDADLLRARVENLLARAAAGRAAPPPSERVAWREVAAFPDEHRATLSGREVVLTRMEFRLLLAFLRQPERVLPRSWLLSQVWESSPAVSTRTVDKHVEALRRKFPPLAERLETVVGVGYLFRP